MITGRLAVAPLLLAMLLAPATSPRTMGAAGWVRCSSGSRKAQSFMLRALFENKITNSLTHHTDKPSLFLLVYRQFMFGSNDSAAGARPWSTAGRIKVLRLTSATHRRSYIYDTKSFVAYLAWIKLESITVQRIGIE